MRAAELIGDGKLDRALKELDEGSELLMALLELSPRDTTMDAQLAYLFGTSSQTFAAAGDKKKAREYQDLAITVFQRLLTNPELSSGDKANAIKNWEIALKNVPELQKPNIPTYEKALKDLKDGK